jgi:hypothetical protein
MSFDINVDTLMDGAAQMFNALWPVFAIVVGLALGVKLVQLIRKEVTSAF